MVLDFKVNRRLVVVMTINFFHLFLSVFGIAGHTLFSLIKRTHRNASFLISCLSLFND